MTARWSGRLVALLAAMLVGALAAGFALPEGTRVTILTGDGGQFLGHGRVTNGQLVLPVLLRDIPSVVVFIDRDPDQLEVLQGLVRGGALIVVVPGRGQVAFGELASNAGVVLAVKPAAGEQPVAGGDGPPEGKGGPPAGKGGPSGGGGGPPTGNPPGPAGKP